MTNDDLAKELKRVRLESYANYRGGFSVPLAGAVYWLVVAGLGATLPYPEAMFYSFLATGAIFPIALLFSKIFKNDFMKDKNVTGNVFIPAVIGMLLFWPMLVGAVKVAPETAILILGIGMSAHWPVIGWSYARTALYSSHAIIRAMVVLFLWQTFPDARMLAIPLAIALIYILTVVAIYIDSGRVKSTLS